MDRPERRYRAVWAVVVFAVLVVPCTVSPAGIDEFRAPKEYVLRGSAVAIAALLVFALAAGGRPAWAAFRRDWIASKQPLNLAVVALLWTLTTVLTSTIRQVSAGSAIYACACFLFFLGACLAARRRTWVAIYVFLIPAVINVVVLLLQELRVWDLYSRLTEPSHRSGLVGNPNDVGAYLLAPAVAAVAICYASDLRRLMHLSVAALLAGGILLTQSVTAIVSYAVAVLVMGALRSWKKTAATVGAIGLVLLLASATYPPLRARAGRMRQAIVQRDYNTLTSYRLTPVVAAWQMFVKHPLTGVGPGCYGWHYFGEKIAAEARHPLLWQFADNFEQAHDDYVQVLAVSGFLGFGILIAALSLIGSISIRKGRGSSSMKGTLSRIYSLPLATGVGVLMIAQFPLELSASMASILYGAALCCAWSTADA